ncbi:HAMP domain-containing sensor histidine kinase [Luteibacter sp. dw_328]|uniref:sensor histidine kinase n=1 Tax=Luteibacter sp. dw_328 TaxID=2719796 RepID=UPI001BD68CF5|nr:HAMP domain-containing sensor histidine kinase [Luteibacter sp. dw_328]
MVKGQKPKRAGVAIPGEDARVALAKEAGILAAGTHSAFAARVAQMIAANEALVLSSLQLREEADASARALKALSLSVGKDNVEHGHHFARLREANEKLVLAALDAHQLLDAAELARVRHADFLAVLAHELRTPLTPISMAASMLDETRLKELPRMRAVIERQVRHITRLLVDVLEVSRVGVGKLRLMKEVLDIADILEQAVETCVPAMDARNQLLHSSLPSTPVEIQGDPVRLAQVFINLLDNASKYTPQGGEITLSVVSTGNALTVTVIDSGIGMTTDILATLFDPFVQDPQAVAFNSGGLGIGLTVVRELVEAHGGHVTATSEGVGEGSRFTVSLPLRDEPQPADAS